MRRRSVLIACALAIVAVTGVGLTARRFHGSRSASPPGEATLERLDRYGRVPTFSLTERSGRRITRDDLLGHVAVVDFMYTECTETCPTQSLQLAQLQREFVDARDLRLVSITVDPRHDSRDVLIRYAARYGAGDRWWFLTGDQHAIYCLATNGFHLSAVDASAPPPPACGRAFWFGPAAAWASHGSEGIITHSARLALIDRAAEIRAYHPATDPESILRLKANLRRLLAERG